MVEECASGRIGIIQKEMEPFPVDFNTLDCNGSILFL
jgi:hypothetical protein